MTSPLCSRVKIKEKERKKREKRVAILKEEKIVRWVIVSQKVTYLVCD